jgi:hypothetical protein
MTVMTLMTVVSGSFLSGAYGSTDSGAFKGEGDADFSGSGGMLGEDDPEEEDLFQNLWENGSQREVVMESLKAD